MLGLCSAVLPCASSPRPALAPPSSRSGSACHGGLGFSCGQAVGGRGRLRSVPPVPWSATAVVGRRQGLRLRAASLTGVPVRWIVRNLVFYAFVRTGVAGRSLVFSQDAEGRSAWMPRSILELLNKDNEADRDRQLIKVRSRWQTTVKGTLKRRYRVPTKAEGRRLLSAISSLLSDDDSFRDAASHKGCQVRRENAHAESVCCHNVRVLFDELPTPHVVVEIIVFPAGPITDAHYAKAEKIEKVLRSGISI